MSALFAVSEAAPLALNLRIELSTLNFLEYAVMSAWYTVLGQYLETLRFSRSSIARIYATMPIGSIVTPLLFGALADKYFDTRWLLAGLHLVGAGLMLSLARAKTERRFYWTAMAYALTYAPTLPLVSSLTFAHLEDPNRDFPFIRVLASLGWIASGVALKFVLRNDERMNNRPMILAAFVSLGTAAFCLFLPATPPKGETSSLPIFETLKLLDNRSFAIFVAASIVVTICLAIYFSFGSLFLEQKVGVKPANVGPMLSIGQMVEMLALFSLPWFIGWVGLKGVFIIGLAAWSLRFFMFSVSRSFVVVLLAVAIHGFACDFFLVAGNILFDEVAPPAISASAQSLYSILTMGVAMYIGSESAGWLNQRLTVTTKDPQTGAENNVTNWRLFWLVPSLGVLAFLVAFIFLY